MLLNLEFSYSPISAHFSLVPNTFFQKAMTHFFTEFFLNFFLKNLFLVGNITNIMTSIQKEGEEWVELPGY